jgi:hypothetical protein
MKHDADFEREKWLVEIELRRRELTLKEREQDNRDAELEIKRRDLANSKWRSPLVVAILVAAVAALGNAGVTVVNGTLQRELENTKRDAELKVEESKAESDRILEMIKTQSTEEAAKNLTFLLDTSLVSDPVRAPKIRAWLASRSAPVLPSGPLTFNQLSSFNTREDRDIEGHDIQRFPSSDIYTCASGCEGNSRCVAFAYDRLNRFCFLKDGLSDALLLPGSTIGVRRPLDLPNASAMPRKINMYRGRRYIAQPFDVRKVDNYQKCEELCLQDGNCVAFNFFKETKFCELLPYILDAEKNDDQVDSGLKTQVPP